MPEPFTVFLHIVVIQLVVMYIELIRLYIEIRVIYIDIEYLYSTHVDTYVVLAIYSCYVSLQ